jgi:hypothetical protein
MSSTLIIFLALGFFLLVLLVIVVAISLRPKHSDAELLRTGELAYATVMDVSKPAQSTKNGMMQVGLKLQVNPPTGEFYETRTTAAVSPVNPAAYYSGMTVRVRYDPKHPKQVVIDDGQQGPSQSTPAPLSDAPMVFKTTFKTKTTFNFPQDGSPGIDLSHVVQGNSSDLSKLPPAIQQLVQAALVDADHNGIPDIMEKGDMTTSNVQVVNLSGRPVDIKASIEKLEKLRAGGIINQEQFDLMRAALEKKSQQQSESGQ